MISLKILNAGSYGQPVIHSLTAPFGKSLETISIFIGGSGRGAAPDYSLEGSHSLPLPAKIQQIENRAILYTCLLSGGGLIP